MACKLSGEETKLLMSFLMRFIDLLIAQPFCRKENEVGLPLCHACLLCLTLIYNLAGGFYIVFSSSFGKGGVRRCGCLCW